MANASGRSNHGSMPPCSQYGQRRMDAFYARNDTAWLRSGRSSVLATKPSRLCWASRLDNGMREWCCSICTSEQTDPSADRHGGKRLHPRCTAGHASDARFETLCSQDAQTVAEELKEIPELPHVSVMCFGEANFSISGADARAR